MKLGIIGAGFIATKVLDSINNIAEIELISIYSNTYAKAQLLKETYNIKKNCLSFKEVLESGIDTIYIASHSNSHYTYSKEALLKNINVICEKPFVLSKEEFDDLEYISRSNNLLWMDAMRSIHLPTINKIKELLNQNIIGEVKYVSISLGRISSRLYRHNKELAGGALFDLGIYPIYILVYLFGLPLNTSSYSQFLESQVDHTTTSIFKYENMLAHFIVSCTSQTQCNLRIQGNNGTIEIIDNLNENNKISVTVDGVKEEIVIDDFIEDGIIYEFNSLLENNHKLNISRQAYQLLFEIKKQIGLTFE